MKIKAIPCEIYSRIVGYYRPVRDWNLGKQEEFGLRHNMSEEEILASAKNPFPCPYDPPAEKPEVTQCVS